MSQSVKMIEQVVQEGLNYDIGHLHITYENNQIGPQIILNSQPILNFTSCGYLGLENHPALTQGVIDVVKIYGTQYASSRAFASIDLYAVLEQKLSELFDAQAIVTASTTLGHQSCLPAVVEDNDLLLMDHQAHASLQQTAMILKANGVKINIFKHNDIADLERKIKSNKCKFNKIWCVIDGVYSMYGDFAPLDEIYALLDKEPQLCLYVDDAHGMSWTGQNGVGYVLSQMKQHDRMIMATSLNKAFACSGGVLLFKNQNWAKKVKNCGSTLIFSGPIQPPMLGAAIQSAKIHLSGEIHRYQAVLRENIAFCNQLISQWQLPVVAKNNAPIFFIACGLPKTTFQLCRSMLEAGYYLNPGVYPAVPFKRGGVRFTITAKHTKAQIKQMIECLAHHHMQVLQKDNISPENIRSQFKTSHIINHSNAVKSNKKNNTKHIHVSVYNSISQIKQTIWDTYFKKANIDSYQGLLNQEQVFSQKNNPCIDENHWRYFYIMITDQKENVLLLTYLTAQRTKDDMLLTADISQSIEAQRALEPYHMTSISLNVGSLVSEGVFYIDEQHPEVNKAIELFFSEVQTLKKTTKATSVMIRGVPYESNKLFDKYMTELGLLRIELPPTHTINSFGWECESSFLRTLGPKYRHNVKKEIISKKHFFQHTYSKNISEQELNQLYELYLNVKNNSYEINTFDLPKSYFSAMLSDPHWDILRLFIPEKSQTIPVAVMFSYQDGYSYAAKFIGLNYEFVRSHNIYKQALYLSLLRAKELRLSPLRLGLTATLEKKKLGAIVEPAIGYLQADSFYHYDEIRSKYA